MAYELFVKPEIASYTDVAALLCVINKDSAANTFWKYKLYGNLCWEYKTNTLYHCGKYDHFSYMEFENEDRVVLKKLARNTSYNKVKEYLNNGFFVLLPINTKKLGYTTLPYKHNVFITGCENDQFIVFDFWTPNFKWRYEKVYCTRLFESIDFTNHETVPMIYAFKCNEDVQKRYDKSPDLSALKNLYTKIWNNNLNVYYDNIKNAYGSAVYPNICQHLKSIDKLTLTDCQNMHVILDHLRFTQNNLNKLFGNSQIVVQIISKYNQLINRANRMRTMTYMYYISQRDLDKIRDILIEEITSIGQIEKTELGHIIVSCGG